MNKRLLLTYEPAAAPKTPGNGIKAVSQIIRDESSKGNDIVEMDLYEAGVLKARWFGSEEENDCCAYIIGAGWKRLKIKNIIQVIKGKDTLKGNNYWYEGENLKWDTREDKDRVEKALEKTITYFEDCIWSDRRCMALNRKAERINKMMITEIPLVPEEMEQWVQKKIFPEEYLFFEKTGKTMKYVCTACGAKGHTKKAWKHNEMIACPKCGAEVIVKSRVHNITQKEGVTLLQKIDDQRWAERLFTAMMTADQNGKKIKLCAELCAIIPIGHTWGKVYYGQYSESDEFEQDWWDRNSVSKRWKESFLYPGNLKEVLPMGGLQNSGIDILAENGRKFEVNKFIVSFHDREYMEYLIKGGFMAMAAEIVRLYGWWGGEGHYLKASGTTYKALFKIDGNRVNRLKQMDGGMIVLAWLQYEETAGIRISQETLEYMQHSRIWPDDMDTFINELGSVNRAVNYMRKQSTRPHKTLELWRDYMRMAAQEGLNVQDDIVRFPKDLKARHDALVMVINERNDKARMRKERSKYRRMDKKIAEHLHEAKIYFYENKEYIFIPAGKCEELMKEGRQQHNCVGASDIYMNRMAKGETWIVFLRRKADINKAYYTLEIDMKDDSIKQWYSEYNRQPDAQAVSKLLTEYKKAVRRERDKQKTKTEIMVSA